MAVGWEEYRKHRCNFDWVTAHEGEIDWKEVRKRESAEELKHALRELAAKFGMAVLVLSYTALFVLTTVLVFPHPPSTAVFLLLLLLYVAVPVCCAWLYYAVLLKLLRLALKRLRSRPSSF